MLIAGSVNMAGAAVLSAKAAYATGCGLVRVLTPGENRTILQCSVPEAVLTTYDKTLVPEEPVLRETLDCRCHCDRSRTRKRKNFCTDIKFCVRIWNVT